MPVLTTTRLSASGVVIRYDDDIPGEHQMPAPMSSAAGADAGPTAKKSGWLRTNSDGTPGMLLGELPAPPFLVGEEALHAADVAVGGAVVPAARVPRAETTHEVAARLAAEVLPAF